MNFLHLVHKHDIVEVRERFAVVAEERHKMIPSLGSKEMDAVAEILSVLTHRWKSI